MDQHNVKEGKRKNRGKYKGMDENFKRDEWDKAIRGTRVRRRKKKELMKTRKVNG